MTRNRSLSNEQPTGVTYFISDLHLSADAPLQTATFCQFLKNEAVNADALYILGDLFDYWLGDHDPDKFEQQVIDALHEFTQTGIPIYFIKGNRDFLIGRHFAKVTGIKLLPDSSSITLYNHRVLIMHGDSLCSLDRIYQIYRWFTHLSIVAWAARFIPRSVRLRIAKYLRQRSQKHQNRLPDYVLDVTDFAVKKAMTHAQVTQLIHGHTHRPKIHEIIVNDQSAQRAVLGAWHQQASVLKYQENGEMRLEFFKLLE